MVWFRPLLLGLKCTTALLARRCRPRCLWGVLTCLVGGALGLGHAADLGTIRGSVQQEAQSIAQHRIMLIRFGPKQEVQRTPGQTDAAGRFVFERLETGPEFSYVVGIRYAGQLYRSAPIVLDGGQVRDEVRVEVGAGGTQALPQDASPSRVSIEQHLMAIVWRENHLEVREVVMIRNTGSTPYGGVPAHAGQVAYSLHLPLPQGYYDLQRPEGLSAEHLQELPAGLYYTAPLEPGKHRLVYTYSLPMPGGVTTVLTQRTLPTGILDVFVDQRHLVATSDLQPQGPLTIASHPFFHFRGTNLAAHSRAWFQVTQLTDSAALVRVSSYGLIIAIALFGVLTPLYGKWRGLGRQERSAPVALEQIRQWHADRVGLLRAVARLDDQRQTGTLDEETYQRRRRECKQQLLDVVERLHEAQQDKEMVS